MAPESKKTGQMIYVVEDTEEINELLCMLLEREGYRFRSFLNADDAYKAIFDEGERPNAILLDLMLPGMDGLEFCTYLKMSRETNPIRVIMLTAKATKEDRRQGLLVGSDQYLFKPFEHQEVLATLKRELEIQQEKEGKPFEQNISVTFGSDESYIKEVNTLMANLLKGSPLSEEQLFELRYFVQELGRNAVEWGNRLDTRKVVHLQCKVNLEEMELIVRDEGTGFKFDEYLDKGFDIMKAVANLTKRTEEGKRTGGFGIISLKNMADRVEYNEAGNEVRLFKRYKKSIG